MKLWHAGFAVKDLEAAIKLWEELGFTLKQKFEKDEPAGHAALLEDEHGAGVELWQFTGDSRLNEYVGRHVAFKVDDARAAAQKLIDQGCKETIPYTEGVMVNYVYVQDEFGTNFELAEVKTGTWSDS